MSVLSVTCCTLLSAVCAFTLVSAAGCGTDARGVDDCRDIEQARCSAAKSCGIITEVDDCQRYYRDQCLHGLPVASPGAAQVKKCVDTIRAAGACAAGADAAASLSDCPDVTRDAPGVDGVCEIVSNPEKAAECAFLTPGADAGSGGASSSGGSSNHAAGAAGDESAGAGGS